MVRPNRMTQTSSRAGQTASGLSLRAALISGAALTFWSTPALSQVLIEDARTEPVETATAAEDGTAADVTVQTGGSVTLDTQGPALTLNSDNDLINNGAVTINDVDGATGVLLEGGADRNFTNGGTIGLTEEFNQENTDGDPFADTGFALGSGRTGILVSGASPFQGNITLEEASVILIEGNESFGVNMENTPVGAALDGTFTNNGRISLTGDNGAAIRAGGDITGDFTNTGTINVTGVNSSGLDIAGDIDGGFLSAGGITANGFRFSDRPGFNPDAAFDRDDLGAEDLGQAASSIAIRGNIGRGINLTRDTEFVEDADGNQVEVTNSVSFISQFGSAPAVLIDGEGTPIAIGRVSAITDPDDENFDEDLLYAFINDGTLRAAGVYDDFDATALSVTDATLEGGISNTGTMSVTTFVGATDRPIEGVELGTGLARVIVLGDNAIADRINNTGIIVAQSSEAIDAVYSDPDNLPAPRPVGAIAIDIAADAQAGSLVNDGLMSSLLIGRNGTAVVVRDASGTLTNIINRAGILASATNSDPNGSAETDFSLIAFDLSANTSGVSILQEAQVDTDPDDDITPLLPGISGDILLGSGDDVITSTAGAIEGDIDFAGGDDELSLSDSTYTGTITNQDGLVISVANNSTLTLGSADPLAVTSASFDETSVFRPVIDGEVGSASTLQASGAISFAAGSIVNPIFNNLIADASTAVGSGGQVFDLATAGTLTVEDLAALNANEDGSFLFDTNYDVAGNTLFVTVDLRNAQQLGLDNTQTGFQDSVFDATIQALQSNNDLGNELANINNAGDFYAAYNQLLPEFAAASRQFVVANTDGAVGAVANHLDSARRSPDKPGGAWIQEFAYFADRDKAGLSEQYRGEGFGFAAGLDKAIGPFHAVGVNVGYASTEIEDVVGVDDPLDVSTLIAGLYAGYASGALGIDIYGGAGLNTFKQNRLVRVGDFIGRSSGEWDGTHITGSIRAGYDIKLSERFWARPVVSLDYLRLKEDGYEESGDIGVALSVDGRTSEMGAVSGLLNFGALFEGQRTWIRPSIRVGYRNEFLSDPILTNYRFLGVDNALLAQTTSADFPSSGILVGFSIAAGSAYSSVGFDFDSDIRDGFIRHTGRIVVRLLF